MQSYDEQYKSGSEQDLNADDSAHYEEIAGDDPIELDGNEKPIETEMGTSLSDVTYFTGLWTSIERHKKGQRPRKSWYEQAVLILGTPAVDKDISTLYEDPPKKDDVE